ncbi:MAG: N-acetylneuraminate synthase [Bacteroidetes bacterium]|nr:N-acetylneuraminate synthase [Bacteroidota bacterium]
MDKVLIIAEAGVNHNGSLDRAKQLVAAAAEAGADIIKFQTFISENLVTASAPKAAYQKKEDATASQYEMLKALELTKADHIELIEHCKRHNIFFFSTAFDLESLDFLASLNLGFWKIPSGELTNLPYLRKIGALNQEAYVSTGMATMKEINDAISVLLKSGLEKEKIIIMHCNTEYPTPMHDVNLKAMLSIQKETGLRIGYSDHTLGIEVPIAAAALGARVIEKHFTLDRTLPGPDHKASLEPGELKMMVSAIRNIEQALGDGIKKPSPSEIENKAVARKSIHLKKNLSAGTLLLEEHLIMKRPGDGISPMKMDEIIGRKVNKDLAADHKLREEDLV